MAHFQYRSRPHNSQGQACTHPSSTLLNHIYQTISRQILCLATFVALHNYHQQIQNTTQNLLKVTMGGIPFTSDIQRIGFKDFIKLKMSIGLNFFNNDYQNWVQIHQIRRKSKSQKFCNNPSESDQLITSGVTCPFISVNNRIHQESPREA